jgi:hypothetical protein
MYTKRLGYFAIALLAFLFNPAPARSGQSQLLYGAMVYIASGPGDTMSGFLASAIAKRKIPLIVSPDRQNANYILAGYAEPKSPDNNTGTVRSQSAPKTVWEGKLVLADAATRAIVWSAEFHGPCPPCDSSPAGATRVLAEKFIRRFQKDLFARESISDRIDDFIAP